MANFVKELATIVTEKTGLQITEDHVHKATRRFYYIPEADEGQPLFLHHYRGPFFLEIPKKDWAKLEAGTVTPESYVDNAQWSYGYYWGGGSMIPGGFFTPLEKERGIHDKELVSKVMNAIKTKGRQVASGYQMTEQEVANWEQIRSLYLHDPRVDLFKQANEIMEEQYGFCLHGMTCRESLDEDELVLSPNYYERTFELVVSDRLVQKLLHHEVTSNINKMRWNLQGKERTVLPVTSGSLNELLAQQGIIEEWEDQEQQLATWSERRKTSTAHVPEENIGFFKKIAKFFH